MVQLAIIQVRKVEPEMADEKAGKTLNRRDFIRNVMHAGAVFSAGGIAGVLLSKSASEEMVWQLDPNLCIQCEKCALNCVLPQSAVKCFHSYSLFCHSSGEHTSPRFF